MNTFENSRKKSGCYIGAFFFAYLLEGRGYIFERVLRVVLESGVPQFRQGFVLSVQRADRESQSCSCDLQLTKHFQEHAVEEIPRGRLAVFSNTGLISMYDFYQGFDSLTHHIK